MPPDLFGQLGVSDRLVQFAVGVLCQSDRLGRVAPEEVHQEVGLALGVVPRFEEDCFWDLELVELLADTFEDAHEGEEMFS